MQTLLTIHVVSFRFGGYHTEFITVYGKMKIVVKSQAKNTSYKWLKLLPVKITIANAGKIFEN